MVGTIPERRDKWCLDNGGVTVSLQDDGDGPYVPDGQPVTTETLVAIPDQTMQDYLDQEAAALLEAITQQAILALKKDSPNILALVGKDNTWVDTKIDLSTGGATNAEIVENIRTTLKEISYTQRDVADILTALYKLGII